MGWLLLDSVDKSWLSLCAPPSQNAGDMVSSFLVASRIRMDTIVGGFPMVGTLVTVSEQYRR